MSLVLYTSPATIRQQTESTRLYSRPTHVRQQLRSVSVKTGRYGGEICGARVT